VLRGKAVGSGRLAVRRETQLLTVSLSGVGAARRTVTKRQSH